MDIATLKHRYGQLPDDRARRLSEPQKNELIDVAMEAGITKVCFDLDIPAAVMIDIFEQGGYRQCTSCDDWFAELELDDDTLECVECCEASSFREPPAEGGVD